MQDTFGQVWAKRPMMIDNQELIIEVIPSPINKGQLEILVSDGNPVETTLSASIVGNRNNSINSILENDRNKRYLNDLVVLASITEFAKEKKILMYQMK